MYSVPLLGSMGTRCARPKVPETAKSTNKESETYELFLGESRLSLTYLFMSRTQEKH